MDASLEARFLVISRAMKPSGPSNFIRDIINADLEEGTYGGRVVTRFPPEPNGYLHIGHAKAICLNFGLARDYQGACHLRFDDTNPTTENVEYVESIQRDVRWLGFDWGDRLFYASDYFQALYDYALQLIDAGKAYVCSLNEADVRAYRGSLTEPGRPSPYRDRSIEENRALFEGMRRGEFEEGAHLLRAKIDMTHPNMKMRDPPIYRIRHAHHFRQGEAWCVYPLYDFAHGLSDSIERITHSICTLEFENNRDLYDWFLDELHIPERPHQHEFARLNLSYTVMSKRKLLQLVTEELVNGWDDPRMPTLAGLRRRGIRAEAIRRFCDLIGVAKNNSQVDIGKLEFCIRDDLNVEVPRVMGVLRPLRVVIENYPEGQVEWIDAPSYPHDVPKEGSRKVPFSRVIHIDAEDFLEKPPKRYHRLAPGREVRLRYAYFIRCERVIRDESSGEIVELRCTYDPETRGGSAPDGRKVKGTIHWVSETHGVPMEVRLYDRLFTVESPDSGEADFKSYLNSDSLVTLRESRIEPSVADAPPGTRFQLERQGYFVTDLVDSKPGELVLNRIVSLRDSWSRQTKEEAPVKTAPKPAPKTDKRRPVRTPKAPVVESPEALHYRETYNLSANDARVLSADAALRTFFEGALSAHNAAKPVANWIVNELLALWKERSVAELPFEGAEMGTLVARIDDGTISGTIAKTVLAAMVAGEGGVETIIEQRGLKQVSDTDSLEPVVAKLLADNADAVARYRAGNKKLIGFFLGQAMRATQGKANPQLLRQLLQERLASD